LRRETRSSASRVASLIAPDGEGYDVSFLTSLREQPGGDSEPEIFLKEKTSTATVSSVLSITAFIKK